MAQDQTWNLREMTIADIIDAAIRVYRHNFAPILAIVALAQTPVMALQVVVGHHLTRVTMGSQGGSAADFPWDRLLVEVFPYVLALLVAALLLPLGEAALAIAVSERYLGRAMTVSGAYQAALRHWSRVLGTGVLYGLVGALAFVAGCGVIGVFLMIALLVRFLFAPAIITVLENRWGLDGMGRSWQLTRGYFWSVLATMSILGLLVAVIAWGVTGPLQLLMMALGDKDPGQVLTLSLVTQALGATLGIVLGPLSMIGAVLLYYDLRVRKEGFDLMMMAQALGWETDATVPAPPLLYPPVASEDTAAPAPKATPSAPAAPPDGGPE